MREAPTLHTSLLGNANTDAVGAGGKWVTGVQHANGADAPAGLVQSYRHGARLICNVVTPPRSLDPVTANRKLTNSATQADTTRDEESGKRLVSLMKSHGEALPDTRRYSSGGIPSSAPTFAPVQGRIIRHPCCCLCESLGRPPPSRSTPRRVRGSIRSTPPVRPYDSRHLALTPGNSVMTVPRFSIPIHQGATK